MADHLTTYLNDHLAGSTVGLELARRSADANDGTELGTLLARLAGEFEEERTVLQSVIEAIGAQQNPAKAAAAWAGEKVGRLKPNNQLTGYSPLSRVVEVEGLSIGIEGKRLLWLALDDLGHPALAGFDLAALAEQAREQREALEPYRLSATASAFSDTAPARSTS